MFIVQAWEWYRPFNLTLSKKVNNCISPKCRLSPLNFKITFFYDKRDVVFLRGWRHISLPLTWKWYSQKIKTSQKDFPHTLHTLIYSVKWHLKRKYVGCLDSHFRHCLSFIQLEVLRNSGAYSTSRQLPPTVLVFSCTSRFSVSYITHLWC